MVYSNLNGKFIAPWIPAKLCWEIGKFLSSGSLTSQKGYVCNEHPQLVVGRWRKSKSKWVGESRQISGAKFLGNLGYGIVYSAMWIAVNETTIPRRVRCSYAFYVTMFRGNCRKSSKSELPTLSISFCLLASDFGENVKYQFLWIVIAPLS